MREIMISIQPQWVEKILNGEKTIEIRKTMPKCELPCKVYIYCTKAKNCFDTCVIHNKNKDKKDYSFCEIGNGKVVAEFTLNKVQEYECELWDDVTFESISEVWYTNDGYNERETEVVATDGESCEMLKKSCLTWEDLRKYLGQAIHTCYAWHIDNLKIYDTPKELSEFYKNNYNKIIDELEFNGCDEKHCKYAVGNSFIGDDGYCDYSGCPKLKLQKPPQSWCYVEEVSNE